MHTSFAIRWVAASALLLTLVTIPVFAVQQNSSPKVDNPVIQPSPIGSNHEVADAGANNLQIAQTAEKLIATREDLRLQKEKNSLIADFQGTLVSIVLWSLGIVASMVLLLVGTSLFTNLKMHEKDIKRLQLDYESKLKELGADIQTKLAKVILDLNDSQDFKGQQNLDRVLDVSAQIREIFESSRTAIEAKIDTVSEKVSQQRVEFSKLQQEHQAMLAEMRRVETVIWELKDVPVNVLITALQGVEAAVEAGQFWLVDNFVKQITEVLKKEYIDGENELDSDMLDFFAGAFEAISDKRPKVVEKLKLLLKECRKTSELL